MVKKRMKEDEEEQKGRLIIGRSSCKVVEYLVPLMSKELLFKFPDNSAFDFDYTQSSIWSPLVPRAHSPMDLDSNFTPKKLTFAARLEELDSCNSSGSSKKITWSGSTTISRKTNKKKKKRVIMGTGASTATCFDINLNILKRNQHKKIVVKPSGFSPTPIKLSCAPFATKGWNKVLKAASKHFKKRKKKDGAGLVVVDHVKLSNYLRRDANY